MDMLVYRLQVIEQLVAAIECNAPAPRHGQETAEQRERRVAYVAGKVGDLQRVMMVAINSATCTDEIDAVHDAYAPLRRLDLSKFTPNNEQE